ncbi:vacuole membrane protein 1 isoform X1 [Schistocerca americana]|uniref:vacuole membrane protein 1 isoform X1 n=2 Tax=Schistocerca americana TaxID=7009 RepID=UPI001F502D60|nr:vacuole membrane protein 1 isoform X1 [Schistocerca americana]
MGTKKNPSQSKTKVSNSNFRKGQGYLSRAHNEAGSSSDDRTDRTEFHNLTKEQLKAELKKRGLKVHGSKADLLQRLNNTMPTTLKRKPEGSTRHSNGESTSLREVFTSREEEVLDRKKLVLWRQPFRTSKYFLQELIVDLQYYGSKLLYHRTTVAACIVLLVFFFMFFNTAGPHQQYVQVLRSKMVWCLYWVGLGVLSSVGLGTGLHTFLLYLGPHIASVTLAAYECGSLNFPEPPYPDEIICSDHPDQQWKASILNIMAKVRLEAMMWGAGTALGELPPYFMARAARLSGYDPDDEDDLNEFEELQRKKNDPQRMTTLDAAKLFIERMVEKVGFLGILACASIPNPLFDLAGITCGHFLVPFWTFFGATLIGKAVIKMHIQKMFVIIAFNETLVEKAVSMLAYVPYIGPKLQEPFKEYLVKQKLKLHRRSGSPLPSESNLLASIFEKFVIAMVLYFIISIINSLAQSYHKRLHKRRKLGKQASD